MGLSGGRGLRYAQIQRKERGPFITIGEYVQFTDPGTYAKLIEITNKPRMLDITEYVLAAADVFKINKYFQRVMTERPKPGRGGLSPGETEEALYD